MPVIENIANSEVEFVLFDKPLLDFQRIPDDFVERQRGIIFAMLASVAAWRRIFAIDEMQLYRLAEPAVNLLLLQ